MDERDRALRSVTYGLFVELGRAPTASEVAGSGDLDRGRRRQRLAAPARRARARARPGDGARSGWRTRSPRCRRPYRVQADGRWWYANCAWDAFGICAALHVDGRIETSCPDCGEPITVEVRDERPDDDSLLFHCLVPAARWWDDIVFT